MGFGEGNNRRVPEEEEEEDEEGKKKKKKKTVLLQVVKCLANVKETKWYSNDTWNKICSMQCSLIGEIISLLQLKLAENLRFSNYKVIILFEN